MTLEKAAPLLTFHKDTIPENSLIQSTKYFTLPHSQKYPETIATSKLQKDGINRHRLLSRTVSDSTFVNNKYATGSYGVGWSYIDGRLAKNKFDSKNEGKTRLGQNSSSNQSHTPERLVRHSSVNEYSNNDSKRNSVSSAAKSVDQGNRASQAQSAISQKPTSREIVLDFPSSGDKSSPSKTEKRSDKIKIRKSDRNQSSLHHSMSMPGLCDESIDSDKFFESKTRSFFPFFRKKIKSSNGMSPCQSVKSNHQVVQRYQSSPNPAPISQRRSEHMPSSSFRERRPSVDSSVSSKLPEYSLNSNSPQTSPALSVISPTISTSNSPPKKEKLPRYTSRTRSAPRRESRRSSKKSEKTSQIDDGLRLEDLPPHPSLYKKSLVKTNSAPTTPIFKHYRISSINNKNNNRPSDENKKRRNSMPEQCKLGEDTGNDTEIGYNIRNSKTQSVQNLRKKSVESSTKTTSEEDSHGTNSSSEQQPKGHTRSNYREEMFLPDTDIRVISDAEDYEYNPTDMTGPLSISLCGCGFLGMYHLGVVSCLAQRGTSFLDRLEKVGGASAGAIMAAVLVTSRDKIEEVAEQLQNMAKEIRKKPLGPLTPGYNFSRSLRFLLDNILPQDAHETAQDKLFVSVTNAETRKNELLSDFTSRDELIESIVASCFIPIYAGIKVPMIRGKKYIDGGLSNNLPRFEAGRTITVSPFDGKSDIGPKLGQEAEKKAHFINVQNQDVQVSTNNLKKSAQAFFPPKRQSLHDYFEKGRYDANRFLIREGLYETTAPPPKKAVLYESSV